MAVQGPVDQRVRLGYVEERQSGEDDEAALSFPDKVGGKPVWVVPDGLPPPQQLLCPKCSLPMWFLVQVYAPLDDCDDAFHRELYLFVCKNCAKFKAFRVQLPEENQYYNETEDETLIPTDWHLPHLCHVCGSPGTSSCSRCHAVHYCSTTHQKFDWDSGHSSECKTLAESPETSLCPRSTSFVFPEMDLVTDLEPDTASDPAITEQMQHKANELMGVDEKEVRNMLEIDPVLVTFQTRVARAPSQILRYVSRECAEPSPLWITNTDKPKEGDVPACPRCGGPRRFEFQLLPQVLYLLKLDPHTSSLDFGTALLYTCECSCPTHTGEAGHNYAEEFVWVQPPQ
eukprot:TRINITY_DN18445_c0_g1_i1.p1 TRINITY_DN18445_c0_g1~~TRINITY_DN18445_c0_g1_i1.p1  ORF type:complete len:343 (-),score=73.11 TRINITY_DN18445_c0_g1_i1:53-1081(-)